MMTRMSSCAPRCYHIKKVVLKKLSFIVQICHPPHGLNPSVVPNSAQLKQAEHILQELILRRVPIGVPPHSEPIPYSNVILHGILLNPAHLPHSRVRLKLLARELAVVEEEFHSFFQCLADLNVFLLEGNNRLPSSSHLL